MKTNKLGKEDSIRGSISIEQLYFSHIMGDLIFSSSLDEFMDYLGQDNIDQLFSLHMEALSNKGIFSKTELMKAIRIDFEKMIFSLLEVRNKSGFQLIHDFFKNDRNGVLEIIPELRTSTIYHLGFEVSQPMDLVLYSFDYWIRKFNQHFSADADRMRIVKKFRFPASMEFQKRVNAYVEIMRIWIELDQKEQMLELFDIHHPVAITTEPQLPGAGSSETWAHPIDDEILIDYNTAIARLLTGDTIWHYAVYVDHPAKVKKLHSHFKQLTARSAVYELPFQALVNNSHDGSLYTKIINKDQKMELEFVTELDPAVVGTNKLSP